MLKLVFRILVFYTSVIIYTHTAKDYGKFKLSILQFNQCKGPKREDCCKFSARILNNTHIDYEMEILKKNTLDRGKILVTMNNKQLLRFQMKKPCDHLFLRPMFQVVLNASQSCEFQKGIYHKVIDLEKIYREYYRGEFLYGNLTFKSLFYSDKCNFACTEVTSNFSPQK